MLIKMLIILMVQQKYKEQKYVIAPTKTTIPT
jgi:hypothetical protein